VVTPPGGEAAREAERARVTAALADLADALRRHLPRRAAEIRRIGRETRSLVGRRGRR
jgi:hypothetical protein